MRDELSFSRFWGFAVKAGFDLGTNPAVYRIVNLINGKIYIGSTENLRRRLQDHARYSTFRNGPLYEAIRAQGISNFLVEELYSCASDDQETRDSIETDLILEHDSVKNGYNIIPGAAGNSEAFTKLWQTEEYRQKRAAAFARPDVKERRRIAANSPEVIAKIRESNARFNSNPEAKAARAEKVRKTWSDPQLRTEHGAKISAYLATPEGKAQRSAQALEVGSRPEYKEKMRASTANLIWITDGRSNSRIAKEKPIPLGWWKGRSGKTQPRKKA